MFNEPCLVCGHKDCDPSFHSLEEQKTFERAKAAYDKFLEVWHECNEVWKKDKEKRNEK